MKKYLLVSNVILNSKSNYVILTNYRPSAFISSQSHYREVLRWEIFLEQELTHQSNFTTELMLIIQTYWIQLHTNFGIDLFISDLSMRRTSTASGSLENLKGHHEELYPHYHLVMSRHSRYIRTVHTVSFLEELRIPIFF